MSETLNTAVSTAPWLLLFMAIAATYLWRGLGTAIAAHIDPESALFQWIACVAYGLLAALQAVGAFFCFFASKIRRRMSSSCKFSTSAESVEDDGRLLRD